MVLGNSRITSIFPPIAEPLDYDLIQPASLDIRLGNEFVYSDGRKWEIEDGQTMPLGRGECVQVTTKERFDIPLQIAAMVKLKSSMARNPNWISIAGAEWIDPGFCGNLSLTLRNWSKAKPFFLEAGKPFAQLIFFEVSGVTHGYDGSYQGSEGVTGAKEKEK